MNRTKPNLDDPESYLPLTPAVFHILLALTGGALHGYGVIRDVRSRTSGGVRLGTGTLYTAIRRLLEQGLVEEAEQSTDERRVYRLRPLGEDVARAEALRLRSLVGLAEERHLLPSGVEE